jgi:hypothetical protein
MNGKSSGGKPGLNEGGFATPRDTNEGSDLTRPAVNSLSRVRVVLLPHLGRGSYGGRGVRIRVISQKLPRIVTKIFTQQARPLTVTRIKESVSGEGHARKRDKRG